MEHEVDLALSLLLEAGKVPLVSAVRALIESSRPPAPSLALAPYSPDLGVYDEISGFGGGR